MYHQIMHHIVETCISNMIYRHNTRHKLLSTAFMGKIDEMAFVDDWYNCNTSSVLEYLSFASLFFN
jgi:hypothetical protein